MLALARCGHRQNARIGEINIREALSRAKSESGFESVYNKTGRRPGGAGARENRSNKREEKYFQI